MQTYALAVNQDRSAIMLYQQSTSIVAMNTNVSYGRTQLQWVSVVETTVYASCIASLNRKLQILVSGV